MIVGISITYNYIPTYLSEVTQINGEMLFITLFLMGLSALFGTTLRGYLIQKNANYTVLFYPVGFAITTFILGLLLKFHFLNFLYY